MVYRPHCRHLGANRYLRWCQDCTYTHRALDNPFRLGRTLMAYCTECCQPCSHTEWSPNSFTCNTCGHAHKGC